MSTFKQIKLENLEEISASAEIFASKPCLHPKFWKNKKINKIFASKLRKIAQDIVESMEITKYLTDIVITGSIASYNWHSLSDIDLHIVLDFKKIDENKELVGKFLQQKKMNWNKAHDIKFSGHEVEIYFQDVEENHESVGVYSLVQSRWLQVPEKNKKSFDICAIKCKAEDIAREIDMVSYFFFKKEYKKAYKKACEIKEKIKKLRASGLESSGVFSVENMAFKLLRNNEYLTKLYSLSSKSYDLMYSRDKLEDLSIKIKKNT